ncbi:glycosyltransferase [Egibacter rhizosphaerae]|uniref:Glycosyltransferase n=1 Tax=Egibacter rhizosphaerae TaxID=1670831 RepID=A0A411YHT6_9ACTN|nr:glycosyltransferase [Egibacter rhizosphaerae]
MAYVRLHPLVLPAVRAARRRRVRVVGELNGPWEDYLEAHPPLRLLEVPLRRWFRRVLAGLDALVVVTSQLAQWVRQFEPRAPEPRVVPNAADPGAFCPRPLDGPPFRVVYAGALWPWQGVEDLLTATARAEWPPNVELLVMGAGPLADQVRDTTARGPVRFLGAVEHSMVPQHLSGALCAVSPKTSHAAHGRVGQSAIKVYEALAAGVPVVVTDIPGQREPVEESGGGAVVPEGRPDRIAEAVARLVSDSEERQAMGRAGRAWIEQGNTWADRIALIEPLLRRPGTRDAR